MKITILHQYHNNMFDTVKALETMAEVEFLSYRVSTLVPGIQARQPRVWGKTVKQYVPWQLWRLLDKTDVLILKHLNDPINCIPYLIAWLRTIRCIVVVQRPTKRSFFGYNLLQHILALFLRTTGVRILAVTQEGHAWAQALGLVSHYIPACINPNRFRLPSGITRATPSSDRLRLLTVSKYQARKHLPELLEAVATLKQRYPMISFHLTIIGGLSPRPESQATYQRVQAIIAQHGLQNHVTLLTNIPYDDMPAHYARADAFILAAESEPLGYAVVEAMAIGIPIFCSTDVGAAAYVEAGHNGYIFAPRSSQTIVKALEHVITRDGVVDTTKIAAHGEWSQELIHTRHAPEFFLHAFQQLQEIVSDKMIK